MLRLAQVFYAFENSTYKHYLFSERRILQFDAYGKNCVELPYTYLPVMRYMTPVNVVSVLMNTDGGVMQIEVAVMYNDAFNKFVFDNSMTTVSKCVKLRTHKNCIVALERQIDVGVMQTICVFNKFETEVFTQLQKGILN